MPTIITFAYHTKNGAVTPNYDEITVELPENYQDFEAQMRAGFSVKNACGGKVRFMQLPEGKSGFYHERPKSNFVSYPMFSGETMNYFPVDLAFQKDAEDSYLDETGRLKN